MAENQAVSHSVSVSHIERVTLKTKLTYPELVQAFEAELGRLEPAVRVGLVQRKATWDEVEQAMVEHGGPHGLMVIEKADQGAITSLSGNIKRCCVYMVGNPAIANRILDIDLRASLYVPLRVCLYAENDGPGAILSFDRPSSLLLSLNQPELDSIGGMLDDKLQGVLDALNTRTGG